MNQRSFADNNYLGYIPPQLLDDAAVSSGYVDMGACHRLFAVVMVGATDITTDAKLEQAQDDADTGLKDITGTEITQVAANGDNRFITIEVESDKLDTANGFQFVRLTITAGDGTAGSQVAGFVMAPARHAPVTQIAAFAESIVLAG